MDKTTIQKIEERQEIIKNKYGETVYNRILTGAVPPARLVEILALPPDDSKKKRS